MTVVVAATIEDVLPEKLGAPAREVWKPDISSLDDAVVSGKLLVPVGKDIVVQYPEPWRETSLMKIMKVFDESSPVETVEVEMVFKNEVVKRKVTQVVGTTCSVGHVRLLDMQKNHFGSTNYLTAKDHGLVLKIWTGKLPPQ